MSIKILFFDYKKSEEEFFENTDLSDFDIEFFEKSLTIDTLKHLPKSLKKETSIISVFIYSEITPEVIAEFENLQIIATRSTGYNHISIDACDNRNIKVLNVEHYGEYSVVQYAMGLILALERNLKIAIEDSYKYKFNEKNYVGRELNELTLGVIGTGAIGTSLCKVANAFDMKILAYDLRPRKELIEKYNVEYTEKEYLIKNADIISLHLPLLPETHNLITKREFSMMKNNAIIINTSRGELVNTEDLYDAIVNKTIAGAGLDVIECEKLGFTSTNFSEESKKNSKTCLLKTTLIQRLVQLPNVIITPHVAYNTQDAVNKILKESFNSIKDGLKGKRTNQVN